MHLYATSRIARARDAPSARETPTCKHLCLSPATPALLSLSLPYCFSISPSVLLPPTRCSIARAHRDIPLAITSVYITEKNNLSCIERREDGTRGVGGERERERERERETRRFSSRFERILCSFFAFLTAFDFTIGGAGKTSGSASRYAAPCMVKRWPRDRAADFPTMDTSHNSRRILITAMHDETRTAQNTRRYIHVARSFDVKVVDEQRNKRTNERAR